MQKRTLLQKLFCNEIGEVSLRKVGFIVVTWSAALAVPGIPLYAQILGGLGGLGAMLTGIGQFDKNDWAAQ